MLYGKQGYFPFLFPLLLCGWVFYLLVILCTTRLQCLGESFGSDLLELKTGS